MRKPTPFRLSLALMLALVLVIPAAALAAEQITLHYFTWATGGSATQIQEDWIEPFQEKFPHIKIEYEAVGFGEFWEKLPVYIATGNAPDIIHMSVGYVYDYAKQGLLENLQPYFDRDLNPDDFFMQPFDAMRYPSMEDGDLYGIPYSFIVSALYYNIDMFDRAGVAYPDETWTWDMAREVSRRFVRDSTGDGVIDKWGYVIDNSDYFFPSLVHAWGGSVLNEDYTQVTLNSPEAIDALTFVVDWVHQDGSALVGSNGDFTRQNAAMALMTTMELPYMREQGVNSNVQIVPAGPEKRVVRLWPDSFAIPADSQYKEEAWEFIKFAITRDEMDRYSGERKIPVYKSLATSADWLQPELMGDKMVFIQSIIYGEPLEWRPNWGAWGSKLRTGIAPALLGQMSPAEAIMRTAEAIQVEVDR